MLAIFPVILPLAFIAFLLLLPRKSKCSNLFTQAGALVILVVSTMVIYQVKQTGTLHLMIGSWEAPFGISITIDMFSALMLFMSGIIGFSVAIYAAAQVDKQRLQHRFFVFYFGVLAGVNGAFSTGDIFNLYVWFEVMLISSFALLTLGNEKKQLRGAVKYVSMNLVSSLFFLSGIAVVYGKFGTLNMAQLADLLAAGNDLNATRIPAALFLIAFGIKAAIFPMFFWLPASYHTPPLAVTALFSGLLTKVGIYSLIRFYGMFFFRDHEFWQPIILILAGFTMVVGVLTAASQYEMRKILSFHIISQVGYMLLGLGLFTVAGVAGAMYYIMHNMAAKTAAFLAAGIVEQKTGSYELRSIGGLYQKYPMLAVLFLLPALSLAGIPPLSGFVGKLALIWGGFDAGQFTITAVAIGVSLITLFSMLKIWNEGFWKKMPDEGQSPAARIKTPNGMMLGLGILAISTIILGVFGHFFLGFSNDAAEGLIHAASSLRQ